MPGDQHTRTVIRFGPFEADLETQELRKQGRRMRLPGQSFQILKMLLERPGELVTREELRTALWPSDTFVDFEHGLHAGVNRLREALGDSADSPRLVETLPRRGYRFIGAITPSIPVPQPLQDGSAAQPVPAAVETNRATVVRPARLRVGRWVVSTISPSCGASDRFVGPITVVANEVQPAQTTSEFQKGFRKWVWVWAGLGGVGLLALLLLARSLFHGVNAVSGASQGRVVVAVVPLQNLSGDPGQDYFVDGLTDEILTQLGQLNPDRLAVVKYGLPATGQQARASGVVRGHQPEWQDRLEGSVRRNNDKVRVSVRLIRANDGTVLWANSFDRRVGDVLGLESEIAQHIGRELQVRVLGHATQKPASPEVVEAYLRGRSELSRYIPVSDTPGAYFERAITLDPTYAPAYAGLADFYCSRAMGNNESAEQAWQQAQRYAAQALSLDSESAETQTAIAWIKLMHEWDWPAAREHALRALQLNPSSPEAHAVYARYLETAGNLDEALNHRKQALALDPYRADLEEQLREEYIFARDYQNTVASARRTVANDANSVTAHEELCYGLGRLKLFDESVAECSRILALWGHSDWIEPYRQEYRKHGYEAAKLLLARKELKVLLKRPHPDLWDLANAYADAGMKDEALRTLLQGVATHEPGLLQIRLDPDFDGIRDDARYRELIWRIGFPSE